MFCLLQTAVCVGRKKKQVIVNRKYVVPYDHLILCTGAQYQVPQPTGLDVSAGATNSDLEQPEQPQPRLHDPAPKNVFVVNDAYEAAVILYWIENNLLYAKSVCLLFWLLLNWF